MTQSPKTQGPEEPKVRYDILDHYFSLFKKMIKSKDGRPFSTLSRSRYFKEQEGYKDRIYEEAQKRLDCWAWKDIEIGSGRIVDRVILAIEQEKPRGGGDPGNNLVEWTSKRGEKSREHRILYQAKTQPKLLAELEELLYDLYVFQTKGDGKLFDLLAAHTRRYPFLAYLFFIKDKRQYLPIKSSIFDGIFRKLKINLRTEFQCSWENYQRFLYVVREVQAFLVMKLNQDIRLLDAHSFLWMLDQEKLIDVGIKLEEQFKGGMPQKLKLEPLPPAKERSTVQKPVERSPKEYGIGEAIRTLQKNKLIGDLGEERVEWAEKEYLRRNDRAKLADKVKIVSEDVSLGYDVLSFELDGREKHIEVKTTEGPLGSQFMLSHAELVKSKAIDNYYLYLVYNIHQPTPEIYYLSKPDFNDPRYFQLNPVNYWVRYRPA